MRRAAGGVLVLAALSACQGRHRWVGSGQTASGGPSSGPAIAVLDLSDGVPEQSGSGWLGLPGRSVTLEDLVKHVETDGTRADARGFLVRFGARVGLGRAAEVGALLARLGRRLPVWCYADDYDNALLYIASRGCQKSWVPPAGGVDAIGLAAQTIYFHKLLADELGLDVDFLQVGKFKGAEEPFTRDGPSPEARQSLQSTLAALRTDWLDGIRTGRPQAAEAVLEDGPYSAAEAERQGLVDSVGYFDDAREALEHATGAVRAEVALGPGASGGQSSGIAEALRDVVGGSMTNQPVMIVRASGAITLEGGGPLGSDGIVERKLSRTLSRLERDSDVRAIVLRIDSPGGSALASDLLWHELMDLRAKKTLVVSIGDMAASGGYYLASAGSTIFADETSIVGSIGVVGGKIAADHALEKIGIHAETFSAKGDDARAEARAAYESPLLPWDDPTRDRVLESMRDVYRLFLERVAKGRGIPVERVAASAEGRIFGGREAMTRGLVDAIGGLREALGKARELAGLGPDAFAGVANETTGILQVLTGDDDGDDTKASPVDLKSVMPELSPFVASLAPMTTHEPILCAVPFALTVR